MPYTYNKRLRDIISESAVKQSLIPVFVCDENFRICLKSIGAERFFPRPIVNGSVLPQLSEDVIERINSSDAPVCGIFKLPKNDAFAIITTGVVCGEKYYALIFEPRILFVSEPIPQYIAESYKNLSGAVEELLSSPREDFGKLERCCSQIVRLSLFWEQAALPEAQHSFAVVDLNREISVVLEECSSMLSVIGASVTLKSLSRTPAVCCCESRIIHIFSSAFIAAAVMLSSDGQAEVSCESDVKDSAVELAVSVNYNGTKKLNDFNELCCYIQPLRLEFAALMDMAERYDIALGCRTAADKLIITCKFASHPAANIKFRAPISSTMAAHIRYIIRGICDLVVDYFENKG